MVQTGAGTASAVQDQTRFGKSGRDSSGLWWWQQQDGQISLLSHCLLLVHNLRQPLSGHTQKFDCFTYQDRLARALY